MVDSDKIVILFYCLIKSNEMKKSFYLISEKSFINNNILDVGVFIEKIILDSDSEDFKSFWDMGNPISDFDLKQKFDTYVEDFIFNFDDVLKNERKQSIDEEFMIYSHLLIDEDQYNMMMKQTTNIPIRKVLVNQFS